MTIQRSPWFLLVLVLLLPATVFAVVNWYEVRFKALPNLGDAGKAFHLRNQQGTRVTGAQWRGKPLIAHYFFTRCPVVCPTMITQLKRVQAAIGADINIVSLTVDPERDSPPQLLEYIRRMDVNTANWTFLTGEKRELYRLARNQFRVTATDGDGGPGDFIHSEQLVLIDAKGRIRGYYKGTDASGVDRLQIDAKKLIN
ncbi:MAG: SCO family protein [Sphingobacteriales bacterium]|nr:MAG: SCO family protein [Sphingobacteriales bacterium]